MIESTGFTGDLEGTEFKLFEGRYRLNYLKININQNSPLLLRTQEFIRIVNFDFIFVITLSYSNF